MNNINSACFYYRDLNLNSQKALLLPAVLRVTLGNFLRSNDTKTIENLIGENFEKTVANIKLTYPLHLSEEIWQDCTQKTKDFCTDHFSQFFEENGILDALDTFRLKCDLEQGYEVSEIPKEDHSLSCAEFALRATRGIKLTINTVKDTFIHLESLGYSPLEKEDSPQKNDLVFLYKDQTLKHVALIERIQEGKLWIYQKEGLNAHHASKKPLEDLPTFYGDRYVIFSDRSLWGIDP